MVLGARYWVLGTGCSVLGARYWVLGTGCSVLGCSVLVACYWLLVRLTDYRLLITDY